MVNLTSHVFPFSKYLDFFCIRYDRLPSKNAFNDVRTWWVKVTKKSTFYHVWAPTFPTIDEVIQAQNETWQREDVLQFEREVTSIRSIQSSVQIRENWYPRNQTCLLILKSPIAETPQELENILKTIAQKGNLKFGIQFNCLLCFLEWGLKWIDINVCLYDCFSNKYVKKWTCQCRFDVKFGFKTPFQALIFGGKIKDYLRIFYDLEPWQCRVIVGRATIRVNSWKSDLGVAKKFVHETN